MSDHPSSAVDRPPTRPRLLFMAQLPPPLHGASNMNRLAATSAALNRRYRVTLLPLRFADDVGDIGRPRLGKLPALARILLRMVAELTFRRPRAVYLTLTPVGISFLRDALFAGVARLFGVVRIYHLRGKGVPAARRSSAWRDRLYCAVFAGAKVIVLSDLLRAEVDGLVPTENLAVVNNGIADPADGWSPERKNAVPRILFLSNMIPEKGFLTLLDALVLLRDRGVDFRADFVGAWLSSDDAAAFAARLRDERLTDKVACHGPLYGGDKAAMLRQADIFAFPTFYPLECFPGVLLEAMAFSLPTVTTEEGAIPDIIEDDVTGFIAPRRDASVMAERLERLIVDPVLRRDMGARARRVFLARFQLRHFEEALCAALDKFTRRPGPEQ